MSCEGREQRSVAFHESSVIDGAIDQDGQSCRVIDAADIAVGAGDPITMLGNSEREGWRGCSVRRWVRAGLLNPLVEITQPPLRCDDGSGARNSVIFRPLQCSSWCCDF